jgi:hypothetical protein
MNALGVVSLKFAEEQPQIFRLRLAKNRPDYAQDDRSFVERTIDSGHWRPLVRKAIRCLSFRRTLSVAEGRRGGRKQASMEGEIRSRNARRVKLESIADTALTRNETWRSECNIHVHHIPFARTGFRSGYNPLNILIAGC